MGPGFESLRAYTLGEVAEWSIAPVLKTDVLKGTGGSNPSLSAENESSNKKVLDYQLVKDFFFYTTYGSNDGFDVIICDQFGFQFATISSWCNKLMFNNL